jgi:hypothetical protein
MAKTAAADEATANHEPPTAAIQATAQGSGCCSGMSMNHGAGVSADAHDAKAGCCGMAAMNHDGGLPAEARSAKVGCCAHMADHQATASSPAFGATKGCSPDLAPEDPSVTE